MRRPPQGDGGEAGPRQPGRGPGSRPGCRRCPRGPGGSQGASPWPGSRGGGPCPGPEEAPAGAHRVGTARGEQAGPQLRSTLAAWEGASRLDATRGVAGVGAAPRQRTPRWARVRETLPPPVHFGAGDPVGRAEVGGHLPQDPRSSPPPERPRPRQGPAPAGPAPAPRPGGSRLARPGPGLPLPEPAPPRPRAPQAGPGLTGEAVPPARRRGSKLPSSVRPSLPLPAAAAPGAGAAASAAAAASTARGTLSL